MTPLFLALVASFVLTLWVVRSAKLHGRLSHDHDTTGPQKFHALPVPRIGGVGIVVGIAAGAGVIGLAR
jgi:UDP-N-acetylmuramyl pentapeptide phosphotransferase/UDP-N-acetylglucosamine-1-phosphate transferase